MSHFILLAIVVFFYMSVWFGISVKVRRNDVADIAWGLGFVLIAWVSYIQSQVSSPAGFIVNCLISIWGLRLTWHIFSRNKRRGEDYRYVAWRTSWGSWFYVRSFFQIFMLQGGLLYIIVLPVLYLHVFDTRQTIGLLDGIGFCIWFIGFLFEAISDFQLRQFTADPAHKGKIMTRGLWKYSRHPNYFGEVMQWWGIFCYVVSVPGGIMTILGPMTITILILFVSGIPLLEKKYANRKDFDAYKRSTSVFFPLPPKRNL